MVTKQIKIEQINKLSTGFSKAKASFLVNCIGLNVEQMTALRKDLKQNQADITVIRNTLARLALKDYSDLKEAYDSHLEGPNAFVLAYDDAVNVAKIIDKLSSDAETFKIKCGILEGNFISDKDVTVLSKLPSIEILRSQFLAVLSAPMTKFLGTLQAVPEGFARVLNAQKEKGN